MSSKFYDALKFIALVLLPAIGSLYFALAGIWNLPAANEVVGTITVVDTFLGVILKLNSTTYHNSDAAHDGVMNVVETPTGLAYDLSLNGNPAKLAGQKSVSFKVQTKLDNTPTE